MTTIAPDKVVSIHYILTNDEGEEIDSSREREPMAYLHGAGNIVDGLERQLEGKAVGDTIKAVVPPEEGYGVPTNLIQPVPLEAFGGEEPQSGMPLMVENEDGSRTQAWIAGMSEGMVIITQDHPLAGVTLHFEVEVMEIRDATKEELSHGHAHTGDGHDH